MADNYPCRNIDLVARLTVDDLLAEEYQGLFINDVWGWVDTNTGKEYVLVGMANGTSFVDISDPENPIMLGRLPDHNEILSQTGKQFHDTGKTAWRDIKVYQNHAFIVGEENNQGVQVFDLTQLRNISDPPITFSETNHYDEVGNSHNIAINEETGFAYVVGSTGFETQCTQGGLHILDLSIPSSPSFETCYDGDGYVHDTQCVIYSGPDESYAGKEICFAANEDTFTIYDVEDKGDINIISSSAYEYASYTHQGWLTEDHRYFLSNDELDENQHNINTRTYIWDILDLENPTLIGEYSHTTPSNDHNMYVRGEKVYASNYRAGLRVLDLERVRYGHLREMAYFDTYPLNDNVNTSIWHGSWSNYPFFESGVIAVTDITNGLFLVRESYDEAYVVKQPVGINACFQDHLNMGIEVGGENLEYKWQVNKGSGFEDIAEYDRYAQTTTDTLHMHEVDFDQNGLEFRCQITPETGTTIYTEPAVLTVGDCTLDVTKELNQIDIFPNPTNRIIYISQAKIKSYRIYTLMGNLVDSGKLVGEKQVDASLLKNGIYILNLETIEGNSSFHRFRKL